MPVEDKAYQTAALCVTAKLARLCPLWVISDRGGRSHTTVHVRFAPKADIIWVHSGRQLLANAAIAAARVSA